MNAFDKLIKAGRDADALRCFAEEYYNGRMGHTRKILLERAADKLDECELEKTEGRFLSKGKIVDYDKMPSRGKETSDGEKTKSHYKACGGRCYVHYDENKWYRVECEKCGDLVSFKTSSLDMAIKIWNDMPDAIG